MMNPTLELTRQLIALRSVTPEDAGCMELISERLDRYGFHTERLDFHDTRNILVRHGEGKPLFVFLGHTDVVPSGPERRWRFPPFMATLHDGKLYGRGAADMKSGVAAMVVALERFVEKHPCHRGAVALLLTSDEEGCAANGVAKVVRLLEARREKIDYCLVGEPSSEDRIGDVIRVGRRGSLCGTLTVHGIQGHVAHPEKVKNPIHLFAPALNELVAEKWDEGNPYFPPTSFQVSNINAGTGAENVVPGHLQVMFNLRYSTELDQEKIERRVKEILDKHGFGYEIDWRLSGVPFLTTKPELIEAVQSALTEVLGAPARTDTGGGTSDGRFIGPTGAQVVELGVRNESIHKIDEHVDVSELEPLTQAYERTLENLML